MRGRGARVRRGLLGTRLGRADPRAKLGACLGLVIAAWGAGPAGFLAALATVGAGWRAAGLGLRPLARALRPASALFGFSLLLHGVTTPDVPLPGTQGWPVTVTLPGLAAGAALCVRLALGLAAARLLTAFTPPPDLARALGWVLRPLQRLTGEGADPGLALLVALRAGPLVGDEAGRLARAVAARSPVPRGRVRWFLLRRGAEALTRRLVRRAEGMARAMACRSWSGAAPRVRGGGAWDAALWGIGFGFLALGIMG